jgi:hypothetical protein
VGPLMARGGQEALVKGSRWTAWHLLQVYLVDRNKSRLTDSSVLAQALPPLGLLPEALGDGDTLFGLRFRTI